MIFFRKLVLPVFFMSLFFAGCAKSEKNEKTNGSGSEKVDFDLSKMNSNMVYAQVFDMLVSPETYENKTIKMKGAFEIYDASEFMEKSYSVIIYDALACCQQGIEFRYDFGGALPEKGTEITVTGKYHVVELDSGISHNFVQADSVEYQESAPTLLPE